MLPSGGALGRNQRLQELILTTCLGVWIQLTSAPVSGEEVVTAAVGQTAVLTAPVTRNIFFIDWYRGTATNNDALIFTYARSRGLPTPGPQYTGRESGSRDGSLRITDLRTTDSGSYTAAARVGFLSHITGAPRQLRVYENVSVPVIQAVTQNPVENGPLVLVCNASGTDVSYQWYQDDQLITSGGRINITNNSQTLTLSPCTRNDTGTSFTCGASNAVSHSTSSPYTLTVSYGPDTPVISACPEQLVYMASSALTLSCTAASYPPALYTWLLNGQSLLRTGPELVINSLTLTDSGNYTCNTSNNVTHRSNQATWGIRVLEVDPPPAGSCWQTTLGVAGGVLLGAAVIVAGMAVHYERRLNRKGTNKDENVYQNPSIINNHDTKNENIRKGCEARSENPGSAADPAYMEMKHGNQAIYDQIKRA